MIQHARRLLLSLGLATAMALGAASAPAMAQVPYLSLIPKNSSKYAAIVVDAKSGEVLYAKRADAPRYPASITKVMTLYLAFEALAAGKIELDDPVVFSPRASAQAPTKLGVRAGDSITVQQAMESMVTRSANDSAVAIAEKLGGTEQRFAALMTLRAQELGMSIQLASSPPPSRASKIQIVEPGSSPKLNGKGKKDAGGRWTIQVGAFRNRSDAREQLQIVEQRFGRHVDDAKAVAEKNNNGRYVARFAGMSEAEARGACKAIKARRQPCMVISPGRG